MPRRKKKSRQQWGLYIAGGAVVIAALGYVLYQQQSTSSFLRTAINTQGSQCELTSARANTYTASKTATALTLQKDLAVKAAWDKALASIGDDAKVACHIDPDGQHQLDTLDCPAGCAPPAMHPDPYFTENKYSGCAINNPGKQPQPAYDPASKKVVWSATVTCFRTCEWVRACTPAQPAVQPPFFTCSPTTQTVKQGDDVTVAVLGQFSANWSAPGSTKTMGTGTRSFTTKYMEPRSKNDPYIITATAINYPLQYSPKKSVCKVVVEPAPTSAPPPTADQLKCQPTPVSPTAGQSVGFNAFKNGLRVKGNWNAPGGTPQTASDQDIFKTTFTFPSTTKQFVTFTDPSSGNNASCEVATVKPLTATTPPPGTPTPTSTPTTTNSPLPSF